MNNDLEKNVLQYSNELQRMTQETEQNLLKIQNDKIKEFKNNVNNISNNCISDIQFLINQTHSKIASNYSKNTIDPTLIDDFQFQVQSILLQAKNDLDTYKNNFDIDVSNSINTEILKLKNFIIENDGKIQSELHEALYQINQSENSALIRLEETYDLGVETIVSAERTALRNLKILSEELSIKLEGKVAEIEKVINNKLQNALNDIKKLEDSAIANITKLEITIKNSLQTEKANIIAELKKLISDFEFTLQGYADEMKAQLTAHKDELLKEIILNKEEIFIELDRVKKSIIGALREKEYEIIQNLNNRAQEIISEIVAVVQGYDLELEKIKTAKIQEFVLALNVIKEQFLSEIIALVDDCLLKLKSATETHKSELFNETAKHLINLRNEYLALVEKFKAEADKKKDQILNELLAHSKAEVEKYIGSLQEQRFHTILPIGQTTIQLPKTFVINDRSKLYIDGVLHLPEAGFFTVDKLNRTITLSKPYSYPTNIFVVCDLPDTNLQALKDQLYIDGDHYVKQSITQIKNTGIEERELVITTSNEQKKQIIAEGNNQKQLLGLYKDECKADMLVKKEELVQISKSEIKEYIDKFRENTYSITIDPNQSVIQVPASEMVLNHSLKLYFDGILQTINKHYTINFLDNSVTILEPFSHPIDVLFLQNLPVTNLPKREATDSEIDGLFAKSYRLGTDKDVDGLYKTRKSSNSDVDSLFI